MPFGGRFFGPRDGWGLPNAAGLVGCGVALKGCGGPERCGAESQHAGAGVISIVVAVSGGGGGKSHPHTLGVHIAKCGGREDFKKRTYRSLPSIFDAPWLGYTGGVDSY